ncbi:flagellar filament capping protein FliD [Paenibacillus silviterrae]|uniref:flagellar filament capping protein FliD n=1 Tax=Paenibacillus silviterrae TaxID=3242194 RepID=UPI0025435126|nr:flagellar filament capping protein FliD [Paenibacillus chinjuensis]
MDTSVPKVTRTYQTTSLWYLMDLERDKRQEKYAFLNPNLPPANAPFYRYAYERYAETSAQSLASLLKSAHSLKLASDDVRSTTGASALDRRKVTGNSHAVAAQAKDHAELQSFTLQVDQAAVSQKNTGAALSRLAPSSVEAGSHRFSLTAGATTKTFRVDFWSGETNEQALGKIRRVINAADMGVTAILARDTTNSTVRLELTADDTGKGHAFSLKDETGNAVDATGLANVEREAENARFRVNGGPAVSSDSNSVRLGGEQVTAFWTKATEGPVTLQVTPDNDAVVKQIAKLVEAYNGLAAAAEEAGALLSPAVTRAMERALPERSLELLGIDKRSDGSLRLDLGASGLQRRLEEDYDAIRQELIGASGLPSQLSKLADKLTGAPSFALLNVHTSPYTSLTNYQYNPMYAPPLQRYLPVPWTGTLMNHHF